MCYDSEMAQSIADRRAQVRKALATRREKLMAQGLCRDCGLNPVAPAREGRKQKPTLCSKCRQDRIDRQAVSKGKMPEPRAPEPSRAPRQAAPKVAPPQSTPAPKNCANILPAHLAGR
jgi:hypothetical protein